MHERLSGAHIAISRAVWTSLSTYLDLATLILNNCFVRRRWRLLCFLLLLCAAPLCRQSSK